MPDAGREVPPVTRSEDAASPVTEGRRQDSLVAKLLPWLLALCLLCCIGLVAIGALQALIDSQILARATPTPAVLSGTAVKLVGPEGGSVTVWQMGGNCEAGPAFGQMPLGSDGQVLDDTCYNRKRKTLYHRLALANGSAGWVEAGAIVPAAEYLPPSPSPTPRPTGTPWPTPTPGPTRPPLPTPLPMGSSFFVGDWGVRVDRVEVAEQLFSPAGDKSVEATGRFALVYLTATNQGARPATLHASSVYIEDAEGNRYQNNNLASAYASSSACPDFALNMEAGASICLVAAIDISEGSSFYVLNLQGTDAWVLLEVP